MFLFFFYNCRRTRRGTRATARPKSFDFRWTSAIQKPQTFHGCPVALTLSLLHLPTYDRRLDFHEPEVFSRALNFLVLTFCISFLFATCHGPEQLFVFLFRHSSRRLLAASPIAHCPRSSRLFIHPFHNIAATATATAAVTVAALAT